MTSFSSVDTRPDLIIAPHKPERSFVVIAVLAILLAMALETREVLLHATMDWGLVVLVFGFAGILAVNFNHYRLGRPRIELSQAGLTAFDLKGSQTFYPWGQLQIFAPGSRPFTIRAALSASTKIAGKAAEGPVFLEFKTKNYATSEKLEDVINRYRAGLLCI